MNSNDSSRPFSDYRFSVAPMMEWTDRHCRYFLRLISRHCLLYTEMITTGAVLYGDRDRLLRYDPAEHPVALQLGGSDPADLAEQEIMPVLFCPQGERLRQSKLEELAGRRRLLLVCGRYEGFDQRVIDILQPEEVSIGDFVLNGGEVAAMVIVDAVARLLPGVLGDEQSNVDDSFSRGNRLLEFPQYTRPREFRGHAVPDVLLGGDHTAIAQWRAEQSRRRTEQRRSDLLSEATNSQTNIESNSHKKP